MENLVKIVNDCIEMDSNLLYGYYKKESPPLLDIPDDIDTKEKTLKTNHMGGDRVNG